MNTFQLAHARMYLLLSTCLLIAACTSNGVTQQTPQYQQWKSQAVQHYRYQLQIDYCPCEPLVVNIEVRNGTVVLETDATTGGPVAPPRPFPLYNTIDRLFDIIEEAKNRRAYAVEVAYDPTLGYPTNIRIDEKENATDDEIAYAIRAFERLQ